MESPDDNKHMGELVRLNLSADSQNNEKQLGSKLGEILLKDDQIELFTSVIENEKKLNNCANSRQFSNERIEKDNTDFQFDGSGIKWTLRAVYDRYSRKPETIRKELKARANLMTMEMYITKPVQTKIKCDQRNKPLAQKPKLSRDQSRVQVPKPK
jgi:hypothetical protein